ncbi:MAG: hypothetical protein WCD35_04035 [Mycobacteriales bacterium]
MTTTLEPDDPFTQRLDAVRSRRRGGLPVLAGSVLAPLGLLLIGVAWLGASHTPVLQEQVAYLISGGLLGVGLVVIGSFLYFAHWQTAQVRETRRVVEALQGVQATLDDVVARLGPAPASLVATPTGTISHRPDCSVVRSRTDLHRAAGHLSPCRICQPA